MSLSMLKCKFDAPWDYKEKQFLHRQTQKHWRSQQPRWVVSVALSVVRLGLTNCATIIGCPVLYHVMQPHCNSLQSSDYHRPVTGWSGCNQEFIFHTRSEYQLKQFDTFLYLSTIDSFLNLTDMSTRSATGCNGTYYDRVKNLICHWKRTRTR